MIQKANLKKIFTFLVIMMPVLNCYISPISSSVGLGEFLILAISPLLLLYKMKGTLIIKEHMLLLYVVYSFLISVIGWQICMDSPVESDVFTRLLRDGAYLFIAFLLSREYFDAALGKRWYEKAATLICGYIYLQTVVYYMTGKILPWVLRFINLNSGYANNAAYFDTFHRMYQGMYRPTSVFLEPAHFAQYVVLYLVFVLFEEDKRENYIKAFFITIAMFLSTSGNAIILAAVVWFIKLVTILKKNMSSRNAKYVIFFITLGTAAILIISARFQVFNYVIGQLKTLGDGSDSSANVRILSGFTFFGQLPLWAKIFGIGFGNYMSFRAKYQIDAAYMSGHIEYNNSVSYILISAGIAGFSIFLYAMYRFYKQASKKMQVAMVMTVIIGLSSSIYSTPVFVLMMSFILNDRRKEEKVCIES